MSWGGNSRYKIEISFSDAIKLFLSHNPSMAVKKPFDSEVQFFTKQNKYDKGYDYYRSLMEESLPGQVNTCIGWENSINFFFTSKTIIWMILFKCVFPLYCDKCGLNNPSLVQSGFCSRYIWPWLRKHECCHSENIFVTGTGWTGKLPMRFVLYRHIPHWPYDPLVQPSIGPMTTQAKKAGCFHYNIHSSKHTQCSSNAHQVQEISLQYTPSAHLVQHFYSALCLADSFQYSPSTHLIFT